MKIIDLLNKIANGEELPKKIKYDTINYFFRSYDYKEVHGELIDEQSSWIEKIDFYKLNDEVEIIEEDKKIPEKLDKYADVSGNFTCEWSFNEKKLKDKINEIIDYLKNKGE